MLKVTIQSNNVNRVSGTSKSGKDYEFYKQAGYVHLPDEPFPTKFEFIVDPDRPYSKGEYVIHSSSIMVDRNSRLSISSQIQLVQQAAVKSA